MSKTAITGSDWTYSLHFVEDAEKKESCRISHEDLISTFRSKVDMNERVNEILLYKCNLMERQLTNVFILHMFVVIDSPNWWWTVEKNTKYIVIQRSKKKGLVCDQLLDPDGSVTRRTKVSNAVSLKLGTGTIGDVVHYLYDTNQLKKKYHINGECCVDFANRVGKHLKDMQPNQSWCVVM
jgi:hypothetical protein